MIKKELKDKLLEALVSDKVPQEYKIAIKDILLDLDEAKSKKDYGSLIMRVIEILGICIQFGSETG